MHLPQQQSLVASKAFSKTVLTYRSAFKRAVRSRILQCSTVLSTVTAVLLSCPNIALSQGRTSTAAPLLQVEGALQRGDAVIPEDRSLYDPYTFEGRAGQAVIITLDSTQFDPYLLLLNEQGQAIAQNDDRTADNQNSTIAVVLPTSGTYQVLANAYNADGRGTYRLTVRGTQPNDPAVREFARRAAEPPQVPVEGVINADQLVTINGIPWAADDWRFSKVLGVQRDSLDGTIVGRTVLDRYGEDAQPVLGIFRSPFSGPRPGRAVVVSSWGSNNSGCYVELILQIATTPDQTVDTSLIVPTQIELVINGQRVTLAAAASRAGAGRHLSFPYTYSVLESQNNQYVSVNYPGVWLMARHVFLVTAEQSQLLRSAPAQDTRMRVTLTNRSPITIEIGDGTVERWSSVYGYNPSCAANARPTR